LLITATAATLVNHQALNAHLIDEEVWLFDEVNIGLAVDLEEGLIVPVLRGASRLSLEEIRAERLRLVEGVRSDTIQPAELMDGTFTITNLGAWQIDAFTPIINPPQVAILGVGRMSERPAIIEGELAARTEMVLSLTFDHRALDGRAAAEFLIELAELLASSKDLGELTGIQVD
ncbi:MAG: 2-oxo acid dehydrogenase subunit E2, partial [Gaiellaceae bacterium]